jgi:hypothetical protein
MGNRKARRLGPGIGFGGGVGAAPLLPEKRWMREYGRQLALVIAVYLAVLVPSLRARGHLGSGGIASLVALAPVLPLAVLPFVVFRSLGTMDERERSLVYRAITFAFFLTGVLTFGYGFLETVGAPKLSMFCVWPLLSASWLVGRLVAPRLP